MNKTRKHTIRTFFSRRMLFFLLCWGGMVGCGSSTGWVEVNEGCLFESETPPLRRVINYADTELCDRHPMIKKKRPKRLRELLEEDE